MRQTKKKNVRRGVWCPVRRVEKEKGNGAKLPFPFILTKVIKHLKRFYFQQYQVSLLPVRQQQPEYRSFP